jgi:hypothetical protein
MRNQRTGSANRLTVRLNNLSGDDCLNMVLLQGQGKQPDSGVDAVRCNQLSLGSKCYIGWGFVAARGLQDYVLMVHVQRSALLLYCRCCCMTGVWKVPLKVDGR